MQLYIQLLRSKINIILIMKTSYPKLTEQQAIFLQKLMPKGYSLQVVYSEEKRQRFKKVDDNYLTQYVLSPNHKKIYQNQRNLREVETSSVRSKLVEPSIINADQAKVDSRKAQIDVTKVSKNSAFLSRIVQKLLAHRSCLPFRLGVDPIKQNVANYFQIIKQPMDLETIERKVKDGSYSRWSELDSDVRLIITNSYTFNPKDTTYHAYTRQFQAYYNKIIEEQRQNAALSKQFQGQADDKGQNIGEKASPKKQSLSIKKNQKMFKQKQQNSGSQKHKTQVVNSGVHSFTLVNQLTAEERQRIFGKIQKLPPHRMQILITLMFGDSLDKDWSEIELDLKLLNDEKFTQLQQYLKQQ